MKNSIKTTFYALAFPLLAGSFINCAEPHTPQAAALIKASQLNWISLGKDGWKPFTGWNTDDYAFSMGKNDDGKRTMALLMTRKPRETGDGMRMWKYPMPTPERRSHMYNGWIIGFSPNGSKICYGEYESDTDASTKQRGRLPYFKLRVFDVPTKESPEYLLKGPLWHSLKTTISSDGTVCAQVGTTHFAKKIILTIHTLRKNDSTQEHQTAYSIELAGRPHKDIGEITFIEDDEQNVTDICVRDEDKNALWQLLVSEILSGESDS